MTKKQIILTIVFGIIFFLGVFNFLTNLNINPNIEGNQEKISQKVSETNIIDELTDERIIIDYVKKHRQLPGYYLTKSEAKKQGWNPSEANLCKVLPGKAIGGDHFGNREGKLPKGQKYYEANVNYKCGKRNADRIIFTKQGEVWLTKDHYKTFEKQ